MATRSDVYQATYNLVQAWLRVQLPGMSPWPDGVALSAQTGYGMTDANLMALINDVYAGLRSQPVLASYAGKIKVPASIQDSIAKLLAGDVLNFERTVASLVSDQIGLP